MPDQEVIQTFGNRVRLRVCGICLEGEHILLVNHRGVGPLDNFWIPPGGGVHFGEPAPEALVREFREETGLEVTVGEFLFVNEFIGLPLHAVELFFRVYATGGRLRLGTDPEVDRQLITAVSFLSFPDVRKLQVAETHNLFRYCNSLPELLLMRGYYRFKPDGPDAVM
jgi:ADP-ribose pyrophosphatase YjhB (NUDIX family)